MQVVEDSVVINSGSVESGLLSEKSFKEKIYEQVQVEIPLISVGTNENPSGLDRFREIVVKNFSGLNFRRVGNVVAEKENWVRTEVYQPTESGQIEVNVYNKENPEPIISEDDRKRKTLEYYSSYKFYTTKKPLRPEEDKIGNDYILCESKNQCYLNPLTFKFDRNLSGDDSMILPREGDLVCLLPVTGKRGRMAEAKYWFICSDQFMKMWTLVMYRDHQTFKTIAIDEKDLRKKVFSGNFTMTSGYRKWMLSCNQSNLVSSSDEIENRFWVVRGERFARDYVHMYSALVLILRYREFPCANNVPNVINYAPVMTSWDLPDGWLHDLTEMYEFEFENYMRVKEVEVFDRSLPPKGTTYP